MKPGSDPELEGGAVLGAMGLFEERLAADAALGAGTGAQALEADVLAAVAADAVAAVVHAPARGIERAQLGEVARSLGLIEVLDQALDRLVAGVGHGADDVVKTVLAHPVEVLPDLAREGRAAALDDGFELLDLLCCECHKKSRCKDHACQ